MIIYDTKSMSGALEQALFEVMHWERLSNEASIEELCKILLVKLYYERQNLKALALEDVTDNVFGEKSGQVYDKLFQAYVPLFLFKGWEKINLKRETLDEVVNLLQPYCFADYNKQELGKLFTFFLQSRFTWYANDYSTPIALTQFIYKVLDVKGFISMYDPCCGIGGMLALAYSQKGEHLVLSGNDISQSMVNITRLHLKMYGYELDDFTCFDYTDFHYSNIITCYDCIVAQIPTRRQAFSIAGKKRGNDFESYDSDYVFMKNIVEQMKVGGIAAIVVSEDVIVDFKKRVVRDFISSNVEILNITKYEDVITKGNFQKTSYYILFLRKTSSIFGRCSATLIRSDSKKEEIDKAARQIKNYIYNDGVIEEDGVCKLFDYNDTSNWNLSLLFIRDRIGKEYPAVTLEEILIKRRDKESINPDREYPMLRVRRRGMGVDVKRTERGGSIADNIYKAKANDVVVSSFEADMGGIGYVPKELDGSFVSKDLYLFEVDKSRVDLNYLMMVLNSDPVLEQLQAMNKRTYALSRISMSGFLSVMIPLPDLHTQKEMAKGLQRYIDKVRKAEDELEEERKAFNKKLFGKE